MLTMICISVGITQLQSTMSLLAQQLGQLQTKSAIKIAPGAQKPTFILDHNTAHNTTIDVLYTMALMGYDEIKKQLPCGAKHLSESLLSEGHKEMNRNKLNQIQNQELSAKITKFLLLISPWFLNRGCQVIIEYLLRNFHIHVFESEQVILLFLQYWRNQAFAKLIQNVQIKKPQLSFVKQIQEEKETNLTYIVKSLAYSRSLLQSLIMFTKTYIREEAQTSDDVDIDILLSTPTNCHLQTEVSYLVKHDPRHFLLQILAELLNRKITTFNKEISELCVYASKQEDRETKNLAMVLSICLLSGHTENPVWVNRVIKNVLNCDEMEEGTFNFLMVIWQRWPKLLTNQFISEAIQKQGFISLMNGFSKSLYMPFYMLFSLYFEQSFQHKGILCQVFEACALKIKEQEFVKAHEAIYFSQLFEVFHLKSSSLNKQELKLMKAFIRNNFLFEYGVYVDSLGKEPLPNIFTESEYEDQTVNFACIPKKMREGTKEPQLEDEMKEQIESQEELEEERQEKTLLTAINSRTKRQYSEIDTSNEQIVKVMKSLVSQYYQSKESSSISQSQKNRLLEYPHIFQSFTQKQFKVDLHNHDYSTVIRYLMKSGTMELCVDVLERASTDQEAARSILFRELCRQAVEKMRSYVSQNYKKVINLLSKLFMKFTKNKNAESLKQLNELMLNLSETVISVAGRTKGKFFKLISCHAKMLANLTLSNVHQDQYVIQTYRRIQDIFGPENTYFILAGAIEILALEQKNNKYFGSFIDGVVLPSLIRDEEEDNFIHYYHFLQAILKLLVFSYHMVGSGKGQLQSDALMEQMSLGVAKKMISNFYGLISDRSKRNIGRKIYMFMSHLVKSPRHTSLFQEMLSSISKKQELKLAAISSKIYAVLVTISDITAGPTMKTINICKQRLIQLFPLQLKIYVLGPLLPLDQVYSQLANELASHSHKKFDSLSHFVNILPNRLTSSWVKFITESMKRGFAPETDVIKTVFDPLMDSEPNCQLEFITCLTEYAREETLEVLELMMAIVFKECQEPTDYSLAVFYSLVKNLKEYAEPYLDQIFKIAFSVQSVHTQEFLKGCCQILTPPTLLVIAKDNWKSVEGLNNFSVFLNYIVEQVSFDSIWKTIQQFSSRSLNLLVSEERDYVDICSLHAQTFVKLALKMNENQLRKVLIDYVRWSSEKTISDSQVRLAFNSRRHLLMNIFEKMSEKFSDIFTHFFGYVFEDIAKDLDGCTIFEQKGLPKEKVKRDRSMSDYAVSCGLKYVQSILKALMGLFSNDPSNQFMDSVKFDLLCPKIGALFNSTGFGKDYLTFVSDWLIPCLICLYRNTADDYKLKSLNTEILRLLKTKDQKVAGCIYGFYEQVIDVLEHRFLLFTDELIPLLVEASNSRNATVKKNVESIIYKVQNLSGQKIENIMR